MGKFRDSLVSLSTAVVNCEGSVEKIDEALTKCATNVSHHFTVVMEGYAHTFMHLNELLKKKGQSLDANLDKTLGEVGDNDVAVFTRSINQAVAAGVTETQKWTQLHNTHVGPAQRLSKELDAKFTEINRLLEKKKKKLLQSSKYKTKVAGYEAALKTLQGTARKLNLAVTSINPPQNEQQFKKYELKATDKVSVVKSRAGMLPVEVKQVETTGKQILTHARNAKTFTLSGQMNAVKAMITDAEGIEKEAPEV